MTEIQQIAFIAIVLLGIVIAEALYIFKNISPFSKKIDEGT